MAVTSWDNLIRAQTEILDTKTRHSPGLTKTNVLQLSNEILRCHHHHQHHHLHPYTASEREKERGEHLLGKKTYFVGLFKVDDRR